MLKRTLTSAILLLLILPLLWFSDNTLILCTAIAILSSMAVYEAINATHYRKGLPIILSIIFAAVIPFAPVFVEYYDFFPFLKGRITYAVVLIFFMFTVLLFSTLLLTHKRYTLENISVIFLLAVIISIFFTSLIYVRRMNPGGNFYIYLVFVGGFMNDTGAYLFGRLLGKHKLAPEISPKKTVEGAIAGVICAVLGFLIAAFLINKFNDDLSINYYAFAICGFFAAIVAQFGDLTASAIKRNFGIKDFGSIMPGHGGILDRFDSIIFVSPFIFIYCGLFPLIKVA